MRKGLTQALMAVAVVMMAAQAMSMAPTIGDIPSPVVGDNETATPGNTFVYPDAIDLTAYVTDFTAEGVVNPPANIMWSYEIIGETAKYRINNRDQLAPTEDPANPPEPKRIDGPGSADDDPLGSNTDAGSKITIRNINLSPIDGPNTDPGPAGIVESETQLVTLYAGDGTTFSSKSIWFYTDNDGLDRLSGGDQVPGIPVYSETFTGTVGNWGYALLSGQAASSYDAVDGAICIGTTTPGGNHLGVWSAPYGSLELIDNAVYMIRAKINSSQASVGLVPFWDLLINSYGNANPSAPSLPLKGLNVFGGNYMFLDNTGSANAAVTARSPMEFVNWWCPSPLVTEQWRDTTEGAFPNGPGPFAPSSAGEKDGFVEFRLLDAEVPGTNGASSMGTLCLTEMVITRFDISELTVVSNKLDQQAMTQAGLNGANSGNGNTRAWGIVGASASFANNAVTITPTGGAMLSVIEPGDYTFDLGTNNSVADNYPVEMTPQTLYRLEFGMSAPTTNDTNSPIDIFWVGADTPTNELINLSYVTVNAWHHAMPKATTPQTYTAFFYSNNATAQTNAAQFHRFRWRMMFGNSDTLGGGETNTGAIRVHSVKVDEVTFPGI